MAGCWVAGGRLRKNETMQKWCDWLEKMKKEDEKRKINKG